MPPSFRPHHHQKHAKSLICFNASSASSILNNCHSTCAHFHSRSKAALVPLHSFSPCHNHRLRSNAAFLPLLRHKSTQQAVDTPSSLNSSQTKDEMPLSASNAADSSIEKPTQPNPAKKPQHPSDRLTSRSASPAAAATSSNSSQSARSQSQMLSVPKPQPFKCRMLVVGIGGAGGNMVDNFIRSQAFQQNELEMLVVNTDAQALQRSLCEHKLQIGRDKCRGLGAGGNPEIGRKSALESLDEFMSIIEGVDSVFLLAGMGGGSGTGALPVLAQECKNRGILTVAVVTTPFMCEGSRRQKIAREALDKDIKDSVDSLIVVPNENIMKVTNAQTSVSEAFHMADDVLLRGVQGVVDLILTPAHVNLDFADVYSVFRDSHHAYMSTGYGYSPVEQPSEDSVSQTGSAPVSTTGYGAPKNVRTNNNASAPTKSRSLQAIEAALNNPLLNIREFDSGKDVLLNITGHNLKMFEVTEIADYLRERVSEDANIILGTNSLDENEEKSKGEQDYIKVTVVITGLDKKAAIEDPSAPSSSQQKKKKEGGFFAWFKENW